jgi:uncharacterized protein (TIGR00251 family)
MAAEGELRLEAARDGHGTLLLVRAQPGARRRGVLGAWNGHLKLGLQSPPEDGRANEELIELVAELAGLARSQVELVRGARSRNKELRLAAPADVVRARLLPLLAPPR